MLLCALLPGAAQSACPGYRLTAVREPGSPDRCAASPPGNSATLSSAPRSRLTPYRGLRIHRHLRAGSPDRCAASPPGNSATLRSAPRSRLTPYRGYGFTAVRGPVARTDAQHRLREITVVLHQPPSGNKVSALFKAGGYYSFSSRRIKIVSASSS